LLHSFMSPISNHRIDEYNGSAEGRLRFPLEVVAAVRAVVPRSVPLGARITGSDWMEGGMTPEDAVALAKALKQAGLDFICVSSGGISAEVKITLGPGYQVPFAESIKRDAGIATGAVGLITTSAQADEIIRSGQADVVLLARELLRDPYWPMRAAGELGSAIAWPAQYLRAGPKGAVPRQG